MSATRSYVMGVDYGTDSVRSIVVDAATGQEMASSVFYYPRWKDQLYCDASINQFRQHPLDYLEGLEETIKRCLVQAGPGVEAGIRAISVDTTGST
ncbi:MAG: ribulokinase, partial [Bacteroidota bacterium]|nr:ribulokinase [Bacteroidota bacterium]